MAAFASVAAGTPIPDGITEENSIKQMLYWVGFTSNAKRNAIFADSLGSFEDFRMMNSKDITTMACAPIHVDWQIDNARRAKNILRTGISGAIFA